MPDRALVALSEDRRWLVVLDPAGARSSSTAERQKTIGI